MGDLLSEYPLRVLFEAQQEILAHGKSTDSILGILSRTAKKLSCDQGFAVIFYDPTTKTAKVRFNDGFQEAELTPISEEFARARSESGRLDLVQLPQVNGRATHSVPLGEPAEPFGLLLTACERDRELPGFEEFKRISNSAISKFMEVELVKLQMEELATLLEVGKAISSTLDLNELLSKIMRMATKVMRCETSTVYLVDRRTQELYFHIIQGDAKVGAKLQEIRLPMGTGLAGWCAKEGKPVIVPDTEKDPRFFRGADKKSGFVTRSMICIPMRLKDEVIGVIQVLNRTGDIPFNDHDIEILEAVANQAVSAIDNARLYENIQKVYLSTVEVLATAIDAKDPYTHGHSRRVTLYSVAIGEELGFEKKNQEDLRYAGLLHDVGKIGIKDSIIGKPERLTDEEYTMIKRHPEIGADILRPVDFLADKIPGVLHHHEYFDGRGYPAHLTGENIPLIGRIICVADAFDAMTSDRPYRKGLSVSVAVNELKKFSGKQFDPVCVDAFLKACEKHSVEWFDKLPDSDELVLKPDSQEIKVKLHGAPEVIKHESQPYPPMFSNEKSVHESQPYPPIHAHGSPNPKSDDDDKASGGNTPSSQPYPPVGMPPKKA